VAAQAERDALTRRAHLFEQTVTLAADPNARALRGEDGRRDRRARATIPAATRVRRGEGDMQRSWTVLVGIMAVAVGHAIAQMPAPAWVPPTGEDGAGQAPIMPVYEEPHHRQIFKRGPMRIIDLQIPPGDTSWFHTHDAPVFYLTVADSQTRTQILGQDWGAGRGRAGGVGPARGAAPGGTPAAGRANAAPPAAGRGAAPGGLGPGRFRPRLMSDVSYAEREVTHRIQNVGTNLYRALGVINETDGDDTTSEEAAGFTVKPEQTNRWFRVYRIALEPGEKSSVHQHKSPVVVLQDTAGRGTAAGAMTFELDDPGQWAYFEAGDRHEITNAGTGRLEVLEVEVRRK
jgi:quercetin dioxygenase-like cupin family protein